MTTRSGLRRMRLLAGLLGLAPLLLAPSTAFGLFPPVIQHPKATVTSVPSDPIVKVQGNPSPPPVVTSPPVSTPEPATILTGLIGAACGGLLWRRKKARA
jgi:hypothetical protein